MTQKDKDPDIALSANRREFLRRGTALVGSLTVASATGGAALAQADRLPPVPEPMTYPGADVGSEPYGMPSPFENEVTRRVTDGYKQLTSYWSQTPLEDLDGTITPNGLFFERHHGGIPEIDPTQHRLMIHGLVDRSMVFTMEEIRRFPSESRIHFIECAGNPPFNRPPAATASDLVGLAACAEWTGVPLRTVLEQVGLRPEAKWVIAEGSDAAAMTRSIPLEKCLDDAMLVYSQNGERLRPAQGYPLRVLLPGFEGNMNVKWVRRLHVTDEPIFSREETSRYSDLMADGTARLFTFYMDAKSIITRPSGTQKIAQGFNEITGLAWTGRGKITRVEVSVDGSETWQEATLQEPVLTRAFTRFRFPWTWDGRPTTIVSRAIDETGYVQPSFEALTAVRGMNSTYHNNATQPWKIAANGDVSNVRIKS